MRQSIQPPLPALVSAMSEPGFYPHRPAAVELRQTHISYVFLTGDLVYKVKKPVRFPFLDYSTLERRYRFCREEVRLNRRLAPRVYLGVVPIRKDEKGFRLGGLDFPPGAPGVVEFAVCMKRLPREQMLDARLARGEVGRATIVAVARRIAVFHGASTVPPGAAAYGGADALARALAGEISELAPLAGYTIRRRDLAAIAAFVEGFLATHRDLFAVRAREGRIREGHGDLRAEHVSIGEEIEIVDCVEFSERLRCGDVASDLAFLAMDLDFHGHSAVSRDLVAAYVDETGDVGLEALLPFYECCRALVRGKVESLRSLEEEVPENERREARACAARYFRLARRYAFPKPAPAVIVVCGLPGTGKSTVARFLADATGFTVLNSDVVRKRLAGIPATARVADAFGGGIYGETFGELTYATLRHEAGRVLGSGRGVIVDATFRKVRHRRLFRNLAEDEAVPIAFVECQADEKEVFRRLKERASRAGEVSDATCEIYRHLRKEFSPLDEIPADRHLHAFPGSEDDLLEALAPLLRPATRAAVADRVPAPASRVCEMRSMDRGPRE